MKKQGFLITLMLLTTGLLTAQHSIGIKMGMGVSDLKTPSILDNLNMMSPLNSFEGGIVYEYTFSPNISLRSGANYVRTGFDIQETITPTIFGIDIPLGGTIRTAFHNIEVPILVKFQASKGPIKPYIAAGPHFTFATAGNLSLLSNILIDIRVLNTPINLDAINYQRMDFGISGLAGVAADLGQASVFAEVHYKTGLSDLYRPDFIDTKIRNQGYGISLGVQYKI